MTRHSAGLLPYRYAKERLEVMLVHPGGPFWASRDEGAWSMAKGLLEPGEDPLEGAMREFREETGFDLDGPFVALGELRQPSGKIVHAWATEARLDAGRLRSNTFTLEWPPRSGTRQAFPEVDRAQWFDLERAREKILAGQREFLDRLAQRVPDRTGARRVRGRAGGSDA